MAFAHIFELPDCTGHTTRLHGGRASNFGASAHFVTTSLHGGNEPDDGCFFPAENRSFSIILLLCTYYILAFNAT